MPKVSIDCEECGQRFERFPSQAGRFCSRACSHAHNAKVGWRTKPKRGRTIKCLGCGDEFYVEPRRGATAHYCSFECKAQNYQSTKLSATCEQCGTDFLYYRTNTAGRYCSKKCEGAHNYRRVSGRECNGKPVVYTATGYLRCWAPNHPRATKGGWVAEHALVMETMLGRHLERGENVHHKNGIRDDNRPENLELWTRPQPVGCRATDLLAWAHEIIEKYGALEDAA